MSSERIESSQEGIIFGGPLGQKRRCTDILCLLLLVAVWALMTSIGLASTGFIESKYIVKGVPERLVNGMDYLGNICGVTHFKTATGKNTINLPVGYLLPSGLALCIETCPEVTNFSQFYCRYEVEAFITSAVKKVNATQGPQKANSTRDSLSLYYTSVKQCMPQLETTLLLGYCQPKLLRDEVSKQMGSTFVSNNITSTSNVTMRHDDDEKSFFGKAMADAYTARYVVFGFGLGVAMVLGFLFLFLIRAPGILAIMVWIIIFAVLVAFGGAGYYMHATSIRWEKEGIRQPREIKATYWLSIGAYVAAACWFVVICCVRKRVALAISCVREASKAIATMPLIMVYPALQVLGLFAFLLPWGIFMAYLASSGDVHAECMCSLSSNAMNVTNNSTNAVSNSTGLISIGSNNTYLGDKGLQCDEGCYMYRTSSYSPCTKGAGVFMMFAWFWTSEFIVALGQLVIAMSISTWYFTREKNTIGNLTFLKTIMVVAIYHLGTCAFGSLIIAIVKTIRAVISYIERQATKGNNRIAQALLKAIQCCLWCIEKCLKFVNKNAYIQTAIHGYSFCKAAQEAFALIIRNALRISAVSIVSEIVLVIGKIFIVSASTTGAYILLNYKYNNVLNSLLFPTGLVFLASYGTANMFNEVFGMAIATILQCFVTDEEKFSPDQRYASGSLAATINATQESRNMSRIVYPKDLKIRHEGEASAPDKQS